MLKRYEAPANPALEELARESPTQRLDRLLHTSAAPLTGGLSPVALALAWADWAWHLAVSPGRQMDLAATAAQLGDRHLAHRDRPRASPPRRPATPTTIRAFATRPGRRGRSTPCAAAFATARPSGATPPTCRA